MKKALILVLGLLFVGANVFASGDLIVNGNIGVGTSTPLGKIDVAGSDTKAISASPTKTNTSFMVGVDLMANDAYSGSSASGALRALSVILTHSGTPTGVNAGAEAANYEMTYNGSGSITQTFAQQNTLSLRSNGNYSITNMYGNIVALYAAGPYSGTHSITNYYGYWSTGYRNSQTVSGTNWRHAYFQSFPNYGGTVANTAGLWIDRQTAGTTNYGIVLNGEGSGADIAFGSGAAKAKIYAKVDGHLYAYDTAGNESIISPHDPETGEWIFYSKNLKTGKTVRVNMEKLVKAVEKLTGETFMLESIAEDK